MSGLIGNDGGKVYSVEANPDIFEKLSETVGINALMSKVELLNCAVYSEPADDLAFTFGSDSTMNGRLNDCKINPDKLKKNEAMIQVKGDTLDNMIPAGEQIDFIKVDIEGAEEMFWYGSERIRRENPQVRILMEFNARRYNDSEQFVKDIFAQGYQMTMIGKDQSHDRLLTADELLGLPTTSHVMLLLEMPGI
jgi:FkbM family methyltransferase